MPSFAINTSPDFPTISILTVVFNGREEIARTISSVLEQTYTHLEFIVIDGGSTDGTLDVIRRHEGGIDVLISEPDEGIYDAMNKGIAAAHGDWLIFMNAGDIFAAANSLQQVAMMIDDDVDVVFSDWIYRETSVRAKADLSRLNVRHQSLVYRRNLHWKYGQYLVGRGVTISDYLFFLSIAHKHWMYCPAPIAICDAVGASSRPRHFYQRIACELIFGKRSVLACCGILLLHPLYRLVKRAILRVR
jgi:glycosyltransferase involved in cell wall biosynthesis